MNKKKKKNGYPKGYPFISFVDFLLNKSDSSCNLT